MPRLEIDQLTFSAAHYIPGHEGGCGNVHGHTYFVTNIWLEYIATDTMGIAVDFGIIKDYFRRWDHKLIVPNQDLEDWRKFYRKMDFNLHQLIGLPQTTCEYMIGYIKQQLYDLTGYWIHFRLSEGPGQGTRD